MFGFKKGNDAAAPVPVQSVGSTPPRNDEVTVQITPTRGCIVNTAMATHIGTREYQQDAAYVCEPIFEERLAFGVLCDGMGGMEEGERVSSDVASFMANRISALAETDEIPPFLEETAERANDMVLESNKTAGKTSGTTLISAVIRKGELYWLNVGDSRIYILRGGEIAQVSRDHNFALELHELVEAGQLTREQAESDPRREALISYIGAPVLELVDVNRSGFKLQYGDTVLLCSDGLTKILTDAEILRVILEYGGDLSGAARALTMTAFDSGAGGMDNTSVILMQYLDKR